MKANFRTCLKLVLQHEGGYVNHPRDPGGATNKGVTQRTYNSWRRRKGQSTRSVRHITDGEISSIYKYQYWDAVKGDSLPWGVDYAVFDYAVNSGPSRAAKELQRVVGVRVDGTIGAQTLEGVLNHSRANIIKGLCSRRMRFLKGLNHWPTFGRGWTRRVNAVREKALMMSASVPMPDDSDSILEATPKANPRDVAIHKTPEGVGGGLTGIGVTGGVITETAESLLPFSEISVIVKYAFVALMLVGVGLTVYALIKNKREE